jgi:hypothetical protein
MGKWIEKLKAQWGLSSAYRVVMVLITFSLAGMAVVLLRDHLYAFLGVTDAGFWIKFLLFLTFFLPTHNLLLLVFGFFLGQFAFFWEYEKRFIRRITKPFRAWRANKE